MSLEYPFLPESKDMLERKMRTCHKDPGATEGHQNNDTQVVINPRVNTNNK